ncbi:MAG: C40 family peptidase [bacterium]
MRVKSINLFFGISCLLIILLGMNFSSCTHSITRSSTRPSFKNQDQARLWRHAQTFLGIPYVFGGSTRAGMDCSGLVVRLYNDVHGIKLPHNTTELYHLGTAVSLRSIELGYLIFFKKVRGTQPSHVGVYLGDGRFIHATESQGVIMSSLKESYYQDRFLGVRKIR